MLSNSAGADQNVIISNLIESIDENGKEVFLYLGNQSIMKALGIVESHFSIMSWIVQEQVQDEGRFAENFILVPSLLISGDSSISHLQNI